MQTKHDPRPGPGACAALLVASLLMCIVIGLGVLLFRTESAGAQKRPGSVACWVTVANVRSATEGAYLAEVDGIERYVLPRSTRHTMLATGRYTCGAFYRWYSLR